jgi:hypothetical protein
VITAALAQAQIENGVASNASPGSASPERAQNSTPSAKRAWRAESRRVGQEVHVTVTFVLRQQRRMEMTLRGPAPSCQVVRRKQFHGVRGVNRYQFRGRINGKVVRAGVYFLSFAPKNSRRALGHLLVQVLSPRQTVLLGETEAPHTGCAATASATTVRGQPFGTAPFAPSLAVLAGASVTPRETRRRTSPAEQNPNEDARPRAADESGALGVSFDLPARPQPAGGDSSFVAGLLLVGLPLLMMMALVVRFLRGTWDPH